MICICSTNNNVSIVNILQTTIKNSNKNIKISHYCNCTTKRHKQVTEVKSKKNYF